MENEWMVLTWMCLSKAEEDWLKAELLKKQDDEEEERTVRSLSQCYYFVREPNS